MGEAPNGGILNTLKSMSEDISLLEQQSLSSTMKESLFCTLVLCICWLFFDHERMQLKPMIAY